VRSRIRSRSNSGTAVIAAMVISGRAGQIHTQRQAVNPDAHGF
jgi:hypothetical protein